MKKLSLFVAILLVIGLASFVYAENSATSMNGKNWREQQVFVEAYNNSGSDISSNMVVIIDTTAAKISSGSTLGAYIATTTSTGSSLVLGVTDEDIDNGYNGRVCVRGPHKCLVTPNGSEAAIWAAGATMGTTSTAGYGSALGGSSDATKFTYFGVLLSKYPVTVSSEGLASGENKDNVLYWIYVGGAGR